jgi:UDP-glucose 4-epimerase
MSLKVLVIGAGGFLGKAVCSKLIASGYDVTGLGRSGPPESADLSRLSWIQSDAGDVDAIHRACADQFAVIHLASGASPAFADANPYKDFASGPALALVALEASRKQSVKRFLFSSSGGTIYGRTTKVPTGETYQPSPQGIYGLGKYVTEQYMGVFSRLYGMKCISLRIANPYGPGQKTGAGQGVIAHALNAAFTGQTFSIFGDGENIRDFIYISDVANAFAACLTYNGHTAAFNVGSGLGISINSIVAQIDTCMGGGALNVTRLPARAVDVPVSLLDIGLITRETGWVPIVSVEDGLTETIRHMKTNMHRKQA